MQLQQLENKSIAILGYGVEGKSTYRFLTQHGIHASNITILDRKTDHDLPANTSSELGERYLSNLEKYEVIFRSPGLTDTLLLQQLPDSTQRDTIKNKFQTQTQIFFDNYQGKVIGITGTKGKTTISTVCHLTLQHAGLDTMLAGNIGTPILDAIDWDNQPDYVVYELSSFMLESLENFHCEIGIFNTIYPTHIAEHGDRDHYIAAKAKLIENSTYSLVGSQVVDQANEFATSTAKLLKKATASLRHYGYQGSYKFDDGRFVINHKKLFKDTAMLLLGDHNRYNCCSILGVCDILNIDYFHLRHVLETFQGVEDRIEYLGKINNIHRFNDAIATTPQATIAAIKALGSNLDTIFLGGIVGDYDFAPLGEMVSQANIKNVILFPDSGALIKKHLQIDKHTIHESLDMHEAVVWAAQHTQAEKIALLSCGSPSFSLWSSYKEKARLFKEAVFGLE